MKSPQPKPSLSPGMYGIPLEDPRHGNEPLALHNERLAEVILGLIVHHHHHGIDRGLEIKQCIIGPPRRFAGIARIEFTYRCEAHGWRHVFAVTDSKEHGLRLWTEVRRYVRKS